MRFFKSKKEKEREAQLKLEFEKQDQLKNESAVAYQETRVQYEFQAKLDELKNEFVELRDSQIRDHAYGLWQEAGCPNGRSDEFWLQAEEELSPEGFEARS